MDSEKQQSRVRKFYSHRKSPFWLKKSIGSNIKRSSPHPSSPYQIQTLRIWCPSRDRRLRPSLQRKVCQGWFYAIEIALPRTAFWRIQVLMNSGRQYVWWRRHCRYRLIWWRIRWRRCWVRMSGHRVFCKSCWSTGWIVISTYLSIAQRGQQASCKVLAARLSWSQL